MAKLSLLLALACALAFTAHAQDLITLSGGQGNPLFPANCKCDRVLAHSPYRATYTPAKAGQLCFTVSLAACDKSCKCCNGQDLFKFELGVDARYKTSVKNVTIDGELRSFEYNTKLNIFRLTRLDKTEKNAAGTKICLNTDLPNPQSTVCLGGNCEVALFNSDKRDCCPVSGVAMPPPLPPIEPGNGFPYCQCDADTSQSTLKVVSTGVTKTTDGLSKYCFKVEGGAAPAGIPLDDLNCGSMDLYKMEFDAEASCGRSLAYTTVDGMKKAPFFQWKPYPMIKVTNINKSAATAPGTEVCLFLRDPCPSLVSMCKTSNCQVAIFNTPSAGEYKCCPTFRFPKF